MNWLQGFLYGFISGITEILPVSSQVHQRILLQIFGQEKNPITNLVIHISVLLALYIGCRNLLTRMRRDQKVFSRGKRRSHSIESKNIYDLRMIRTSMIPMLLGLLALAFTRSWAENSLLIALFCLIGGVILFVSERFPQGNKDSRHMSVLDAVFFGLTSALAVFPGISRIGTSMSYATIRGVNKQQSLTWALLLSIPALLVLCVFDIADIVTVQGLVTNFSVIIGYFTAAFGAFSGTYLCIFFIRTLLNRSGIGVFAYYTWGLALLAFTLYLIS